AWYVTLPLVQSLAACCRPDQPEFDRRQRIPAHAPTADGFGQVVLPGLRCGDALSFEDLAPCFRVSFGTRACAEAGLVRPGLDHLAGVVDSQQQHDLRIEPCADRE